MKKALITGITGQDGSYLAEHLLELGYEVHGLVRRNSINLYENISGILNRITLHQGELCSGSHIRDLLDSVQPDEIYNLAAQSHVNTSYALPEITADINGMGPLRLLEAMRSLKLLDKTRFFQASTSDLFGQVDAEYQNEDTPFAPNNPYAIAKLFAHWTVVNYRKNGGIFACNGIMFNHESPRRGITFVTKKITQALARIALGENHVLELGNLDIKKDWGHAKDFTEAMVKMLQHDTPDDYVLATGTQHSIKEFCECAADYFGISLTWEGSGVDTYAVDIKNSKKIIQINPIFYRPADVGSRKGDYSKAFNKIKWSPKHNFKCLVSDMCQKDFDLYKDKK